MNRPDWDLYFIKIAKVVAERSTCPRASVGAVIVDEKHRILSTGYNGAPAGTVQCGEDGCIIVDGHCVRAIHAEQNAMEDAVDRDVDIAGATLYYWDSKGRYAQTIEDFTKICPICGGLATIFCIGRICGRGL